MSQSYGTRSPNKLLRTLRSRALPSWSVFLSSVGQLFSKLCAARVRHIPGRRGFISTSISEFRIQVDVQRHNGKPTATSLVTNHEELEIRKPLAEVIDYDCENPASPAVKLRYEKALGSLQNCRSKFIFARKGIAHASCAFDHVACA